MDESLLRLPAVLERTALSRTKLYELVDAGRFPRPFKLAGTRTNVWPASAVARWIDLQIPRAEAHQSKEYQQ